ncbi:MAG: hypothetical protein KJ697_03685 [Nanoarchaeota archaeon]|nr:hypothetical protein [Nanoarchaeota archaeon]MBU4124485.1 hypothetical protein [Nanoarchaeota archaeon]
MNKEFPSVGSIPYLNQMLPKGTLEATRLILTKDDKYKLSEQLGSNKTIMPVDIAMKLGNKKTKEIGDVMENLTSMGFYKKTGSTFPKYMLTPEAVEYLSREL